jgi:Na+/H+-dicarboxylate symporter
MAYSVSRFGIASLKDLGLLMVIFFGTCIFFVVFILGGIMRFYCRLSLRQFIGYIRDEIMICFGTASSETVLPRLMDKLMALGCSKQVVGMVVPTGYSFNLDGTSLYLALATMFIAYATGIDLTFWQQALIIGILLVTSKGTAAIYGTAFLVLSGTLTTLKIFPDDKLAIILALLFSVDRIMAPGRVITNLIGNGVATIFIARWEGELDHGKAKAILDGSRKPELLEG